MKDKIMVFIPMYNCENQIERVLGKFDERAQKLFKEIVVIDNISPDDSILNAKKGLKNLSHVKTTLLKNHENYSLGGSIKVAFNYAIEHKYDYVITLHGDDQGNIQDILSYLEGGLYSEHDIVVGARFHKDSILKGYSLIRTVGNHVVNFICSVITRKKIDDMVAGLNIFKTSFLSNDFYKFYPNNLTFDAHVLLYALSKKKSVEYIPISWREEDQVSNAKVVRQGITLLKLFLKYFLLKEKMFKTQENEFSRINYSSEVVMQNEVVKND